MNQENKWSMEGRGCEPVTCSRGKILKKSLVTAQHSTRRVLLALARSLYYDESVQIEVVARNT